MAARWLRAEGHRLVGRNLRTPFAEVDLAFVRNDLLVVVEVKTGRASGAPSARWRPADRVSPRQRARLQRAARALARAKGVVRWSVAVLEVRLERVGARIEWVGPAPGDGSVEVVRRTGVIRF